MSDGTDSGITTPRDGVARGARSLGKTPPFELVTAADIQLGDEVWLPSSRHPVEITSVQRFEQPPGVESCRLIAPGTEWVVRLDQEIKRVFKRDTNDV